jgi:hypothetical protein
MSTGAACLLDSNILLRISRAMIPSTLRSARLPALVGQGVRLSYTPQTLVSFGTPQRVL